MTLLRPKLTFSIAAGVALSVVFGLAVPICLVKVIDSGLARGDFNATLYWVLCAAGAQAVSGLIGYISKRQAHREALESESEARTSLYALATGADLRAMTDNDHGTTMGRILFAATSLREWTEIRYTQGIPLVVSGAGTVSILATLSWPLACLTLALLPMGAVMWLWLRRRFRPSARQNFEAQENVYRIIIETFRALPFIRAMRKQDEFSKRFGTACQTCVTTGTRLQSQLAIQGPFFDIYQALVLVAVFGVGGHAVIEGSFSLGALVGFQLYLARLFPLLRSGTGLFAAWQHFQEGRARASQFLTLPKATPVHFEACTLPNVLDVRHVDFSFGEHPVWQNFSLTLCAGDRYALLQPSGSGKTTLACLILGLYPPDAGQIALANASPGATGYVPQSSILFEGTLRDNVVFLHQNLDDTAYAQLLKIVCLQEVAGRIGNQSIGENGAKLSGGEQRRVMLARALATEPKLLIIDQLTSELEPELCRTIFANLRKHRPDLAILYLGHRQPEWD